MLYKIYLKNVHRGFFMFASRIFLNFKYGNGQHFTLNNIIQSKYQTISIKIIINKNITT